MEFLLADEPFGYDTDGDGFIDTEDRGSFFGYDFDGDGDIDADDDFAGFILAERGDVCFVATAVYGDIDHPQVKKLRDFRDEILTKSAVGRGFIRWYYRNGPALACWMEGRGHVRHGIRRILEAFIEFMGYE